MLPSALLVWDQASFQVIVTHLGIEVNPDQVKAINSLQPPRNPKEVQKLTGMIAALNQFIFRLADRCRPFFQLLNKWKRFEWTEECVLAFQQLKEYLSQPPVMSRPEVDEVLFTYIVVASHVVSLVLIRVDDGVQRPVYYVSKSLHEAEVRYLRGTCYMQTPPLLPVPHSCCFNPTSTSITTSEC